MMSRSQRLADLDAPPLGGRPGLVGRLIFRARLRSAHRMRVASAAVIALWVLLRVVVPSFETDAQVQTHPRSDSGTSQPTPSVPATPQTLSDELRVSVDGVAAGDAAEAIHYIGPGTQAPNTAVEVAIESIGPSSDVTASQVTVLTAAGDTPPGDAFAVGLATFQALTNTEWSVDGIVAASGTLSSDGTVLDSEDPSEAGRAARRDDVALLLVPAGQGGKARSTAGSVRVVEVVTFLDALALLGAG